MRKISLKSIIRVLLIFVVVAGSITAVVYGCFQLRGLKQRATAVENRVNDLENSYYSTEEAFGETSEVEFAVESQEVRSLRIQDSYYSQEPTYTEKPTHIITVKIKNNSDWVFDFGGSDLRAQTDKGLLITQAIVHPEDANTDEMYLSLAPGAEHVAKLYFVAPEGQKIMNLYDGASQKKLEFN